MTTQITVEQFSAAVAKQRGSQPLIIYEIDELSNLFPQVKEEIKRINNLENRNIVIVDEVREFVRKTYPLGKLITTGEPIELTDQVIQKIITFVFTVYC